MSSPLRRLADWYRGHCDGLWEHQHGFKIETLDNPGFTFSVALADTALESIDFERLEDDYDSEDHWMVCWKEDGEFRAAGAPGRLEDMIECFLAWSARNSGA